MINVSDIAYHRNGIGGEGFHVVCFTSDEDKETEMLAVVFPTPPGGNPHTAVFNRALLGEGIIAFGRNSFRGDHYDDELRQRIRAFEGISEPGGGVFEHEGHEYMVIEWDWKEPVPAHDISFAAKAGYSEMALVQESFMDANYLIAAQSDGHEWDAQAVYEAWDSSLNEEAEEEAEES